MTLKGKILAVVSFALLAFAGVSGMEKYTSQERGQKNLYQAYGLGQSKLWDQILRTNHVFLHNNVSAITRDTGLIDALWREDGPALADAITPTFNRLSAEGAVSRIVVVSKSGRIIYDTVEDSPISMDSVRLAEESSKNVMGLASDRKGRIYSVFTFPVFSSAQPSGIVIFALDVKPLLKEYASDWNAAAGIVDDQTRAVSQTAPERFDISKVVTPPVGMEHHDILKSNGSIFFVTTLPVNGVGAKPFAHLVTATNATAFVQEQRRSLLIVIGVLSLSFIVLLWAIIQMIARSLMPLNLVAGALQTLATGDTTVHIDEAAEDDEVGRISRAALALLQKMIEREKLKEAHEFESRKKIELMAEKEKAEQANQVKSHFLATMSHELRTPLNSIVGLASMFVQDTALDGEHHEMAVIIRKSSLVLLNIINDILDISKIESGILRLEKINFDLKEAVSSVMQTLLPIASARGLTLRSEYKRKDFPAFVVGDPLRIGRILTNLVSNAIKYTEKGCVQIDIDFIPLGEASIELICKVTDTGIGIPQDKLVKIFEKFTQADETITRKYGGTGLGLSISKELVEIMGGKIGVESTVGQGSTFWFRIPFETADNMQIPPSAEAGKKPQFVMSASRKKAEQARVLLAEDHLLNQVFMRKLLERMGFKHIDIKENGQFALQAFFEHGNYDLILMDCHMPGMNGYDATMAIRRHEEENGGHVPILAMTADAMTGTREKCLATGMDDYVSKPVDADDLKSIFSHWVIFSDEKGAQMPGTKNTGKNAGEGTPCVDISALRNFADTPEESRMFVDVFVSQSEADLKTLQEACVDGESKKWKETAHKLKGGCGVAGAFVMRQICAEAQEMLVATTAERQAKCKEIEKALEEAKAFFQNASGGTA